MSIVRRHSGLAVILAAFLALGALYLRTTPLLETPDEPSHFSVVKYIADEGSLPPARPPPPDAGPVPVIFSGPPVYYAPPLYYVLGALLIADLDTDGFAQAVIPNPNWARGWAPTPGRSPENKHIYVHTADQRPPYAGWAVAMVRLRIFSLLLGGVTVSGVYALAQAVWPRPAAPERRFGGQGWALAATALVAFNPAFLFVTVGVTNDALLIALSTWAFVLMARLVLVPSCSALRSVLSLGVLMGLAALTKQSALVFLPVAAQAVLWGVRLNCPDEGGQESAGIGGGIERQGQAWPWRTALRWLLLWGALVTLLGGWWYLHNSLANGDPLGFQPHQVPGWEWKPPLSLLARQFGQALRGYWGTFGWGLILVEPAVYAGVALFVVVGLLGLLVRFFSGGARRPANTQNRALAILALGVLFNMIGLVLWLLRTSAPYGRLLFPTLGPLAVLLVIGWRHWLGRKYGQPFAWTIVLILGLYAAVVPWRYLRPAYASPIVPASAVEEAAPLDVEFDVGDTATESNNEALRLLGYRFAPENARPGDRVTLTLYWRATARLNKPLTVFVQVAPKDPEQRVAGLDDYLGSSRYPSQVWQPGETIRQTHQLQLPDEAPAPVLYWFTVGLYGESDSTRLPVTADGTPVPDRVVRLGPLRVLSGDRPQPVQQVDYRLGSAIRLTGYDLDPPALHSSGVLQKDAVTVTLYWQAVAAPEQDLIVFVHLLDKEGQRVIQHDSPPRQGDYPTWAWQEGDQVPDPHTLHLPRDQKPGTYRLLVGLYQPEDGQRIPVFNSAGQRVPDDTLILTDIRLVAESE